MNDCVTITIDGQKLYVSNYDPGTKDSTHYRLQYDKTYKDVWVSTKKCKTLQTNLQKPINTPPPQAPAVQQNLTNIAQNQRAPPSAVALSQQKAEFNCKEDMKTLGVKIDAFINQYDHDMQQIREYFVDDNMTRLSNKLTNYVGFNKGTNAANIQVNILIDVTSAWNAGKQRFYNIKDQLTSLFNSDLKEVTDAYIELKKKQADVFSKFVLRDTTRVSRCNDLKQMLNRFVKLYYDNQKRIDEICKIIMKLNNWENPSNQSSNSKSSSLLKVLPLF